MVGRWSFLLGMAYFHRWTVSFREGKRAQTNYPPQIMQEAEISWESAWRIIPVRKWLVTPIFAPFRFSRKGFHNPILRGPITITMATNHVSPSPAMILQVRPSDSCWKNVWIPNLQIWGAWVKPLARWCVFKQTCFFSSRFILNIGGNDLIWQVFRCQMGGSTTNYYRYYNLPIIHV